MQCDSCGTPLSLAQQATPEALTDEDRPTVNLPPPPDLYLGRVLGGRYQLDACIGTGGMGAIYRARRLHIGDTVAVKVLRPEVLENAVSRERFHREARAAAMLHHPNAVVIHDFGEDADGTAYIVMELLEGRSLRQLLQEERTITPERTYGIVRQACAAVEAAHRRGVIHRDLKPDNIILMDEHDGSDHVKILDFGIAKLRDKSSDKLSLEKSLTNVGTVIGTPYYMSPEQCQGEPADARSDIYSMGVVLYEMLTGVIPFSAKTPTAVAIKHVTEAPKPLSELRPDLALAVERVVLRALAKEPDARQQSALELSRELETAIKGAKIETPAVSKADAATTEISAESFSTAVIPSANTGDHEPNFETQVAPAAVPTPVPSATPVPTPTPMPLIEPAPSAKAPPRRLSSTTIASGVVLVLVIAVIGGWLLRMGRGPATSSELATPTPAEAAPSATPSTAAPAGSAPEGMVYVAGGELRLGRDNGEENERPSHLVTVKPFFIDQTEVTNEQYQKFIEATGHAPPPAWQGPRFPEGAEKLPVTDVTWEDAQAYAQWAGKRLPTEEEWEFAARGAEGRLYPWGQETRTDVANVSESQNDKRSLTPVGQYPLGASPFGALDMAGNAWEWTASEYKPYPGGNPPAPPEGYLNLKILRGGSYASLAKQTTATLRQAWPATRNDWPDSTQMPDRRIIDYTRIGFRCAKDISQQ
jgi:serine/threonine-protein kinase